MEEEITPEEWAGDAPEELRTLIQNMGLRTYTTEFLEHVSKPGGPMVELTMDEESAGTEKMFCFAGPIDHALQNGQVVVVDEMNNSLHPALVQYLVICSTILPGTPVGPNWCFPPMTPVF